MRCLNKLILMLSLVLISVFSLSAEEMVISEMIVDAPIENYELADTLMVDSLSLGVVDGIVLINRVELPDSTTVFDNEFVLEPNFMFIPIIFEKYDNIDNESPRYRPKKRSLRSETAMELSKSDNWLNKQKSKRNFERYNINRVIAKRPNLVLYNVDMLPEPPKQYVIVNDPAKVILSVEAIQVEIEADAVASVAEIKPKKWVTAFDSSVQFSQAYLSDNWYQGGEGNLNVLGNIQYSFNLNPNLYEKILFENSVQYNISMNSASQDSLRGYAISTDQLQINSKFGVKAVEKWYYSATLQFKTQLFQNYTANTNDLNTSFLTPGELNIGLGMTYDLSESDKKYTFSASVSPLSYSMKTCINSEKVDFADLGYTTEKHVQNSIGSSAEGNFVWNINSVFTYTTRLYAFTDYGSVQSDWENTLSIAASKYLSTNVYVHVRYDDSTTSSEGWDNWQLKEIISFGFSYKF